MGKDGMNGKPGKGSIQKRLEQLENLISLKKPRLITLIVDAHSDDRKADEDAILQELAVVDADLVIRLQHYSGKDMDLPRLQL
jgi:hypothetical protein